MGMRAKGKELPGSVREPLKVVARSEVFARETQKTMRTKRLGLGNMKQLHAM